MCGGKKDEVHKGLCQRAPSTIWCLCMHAWMHVRMYACMHRYMHTCMYACMHHMHTCMQTYMHACIHHAYMHLIKHKEWLVLCIIIFCSFGSEARGVLAHLLWSTFSAQACRWKRRVHMPIILECLPGFLECSPCFSFPCFFFLLLALSEASSPSELLHELQAVFAISLC